MRIEGLTIHTLRSTNLRSMSLRSTNLRSTNPVCGSQDHSGFRLNGLVNLRLDSD